MNGYRDSGPPPVEFRTGVEATATETNIEQQLDIQIMSSRLV